jgi:hypothetical protein
MIRITSLVWFSLFSLVAHAEGAPTELQHYKVKVPASRPTCEEEATQLAARFHEATGVAVEAASCLGRDVLEAQGYRYVFYSLDVSYRAERKLESYTAVYGRSESFGVPSDLEGIYPTFDSCLSALPEQSSRFQAATGLLDVAHVCAPASYGIYGKSYVLKIEGFGKPAKRLRIMELKFMGRAGHDTGSRVEDMMTTLGANVVAHTGGEQVLFYAPENFEVKHDYVATLGTRQQCEAQLAEARFIFNKLGSSASLIVCSRNASGGYYLEGFREGRYFLTSDGGRTFAKFYSFEACMNEVPYSNTLTNYAGGICHASNLTGNEFELELFSAL